MPVQRCSVDGRPGFKWGEAGKCYTYSPGDTQARDRARNLAEKQGQAIEAGKRGGKRK